MGKLMVRGVDTVGQLTRAEVRGNGMGGGVGLTTTPPPGSAPVTKGGPREGEGVIHPPFRERQEKGGGVRVDVGVCVALKVGVGENVSTVLSLGEVLVDMECEGDTEVDMEWVRLVEKDSEGGAEGVLAQEGVTWAEVEPEGDGEVDPMKAMALAKN